MNRLSVLHHFGLMLLLLCLLWKGANGQGRKPIEPPPPFRVAHRDRPADYRCFPKHHYSLEARLHVDPGAPCKGKYQLLLSFFRENNIIIGISQIPLVELFDGPLK